MSGSSPVREEPLEGFVITPGVFCLQFHGQRACLAGYSPWVKSWTQLSILTTWHGMDYKIMFSYTSSCSLWQIRQATVRPFQESLQGPEIEKDKEFVLWSLYPNIFPLLFFRPNLCVPAYPMIVSETEVILFPMFMISKYLYVFLNFNPFPLRNYLVWP